jgi:hypothetical protein
MSLGCAPWGVLFASLLALGGCTGPRAVAPVNDGEPTELRLLAGDTIRVVTKGRERLSFEITEIRATELAGITVAPRKHETMPAGVGVAVPYADLALVEVRRFSAARSLAVPAVVVLVAAGIALQTVPVMPAAP